MIAAIHLSDEHTPQPIPPVDDDDDDDNKSKPGSGGGNIDPDDDDGGSYDDDDDDDEDETQWTEPHPAPPTCAVIWRQSYVNQCTERDLRSRCLQA